MNYPLHSKKYFSFLFFLIASCRPCSWIIDVMYLWYIFCYLKKVETAVLINIEIIMLVILGLKYIFLIEYNEM